MRDDEIKLLKYHQRQKSIQHHVLQVTTIIRLGVFQFLSNLEIMNTKIKTFSTRFLIVWRGFMK